MRPGQDGTKRLDIASRVERVAALERDIDAGDANEVVDAIGLLTFPGVGDSIAIGGSITRWKRSCLREPRRCPGGHHQLHQLHSTGQYYLNRGGPYEEFFPQVLALARAGLRRLRVPCRPDGASAHRRDPPTRGAIRSYLVQDLHVLRRHGLHGRSDDQSSFLMTPPGERYDYAHFEFVMRGIADARERFSDIAHQISLSLHCGPQRS